MNNREILEHRIKIMQAFLDNKEIQHRHDNGEVGGLWYNGPGPKSPIPNFSLYEYRIKPETNKYRVGLYRTSNYYHTLTVSDDGTANFREYNDPTFVRWLTNWVEYEV